MYCSSCGMKVTAGLSYCNHCGAKLYGPKDGNAKSSEVKPETLVGGMAAVFIFGLGAMIGLMMALKMVFGAENMGLIIALTFMSFMIMLGVEGIFAVMLLRRKKGANETSDTDRHNTASELSESQARMLPEHPFSVTEHTTRTLEPLQAKQKTE